MRVLGRPSLGWMEDVNVAVRCKGMTVKAAQQCEKDRNGRRALVHMWMIFTRPYLIGIHMLFANPLTRSGG